jgi:hypothetical protein
MRPAIVLLTCSMRQFPNGNDLGLVPLKMVFQKYDSRRMAKRIEYTDVFGLRVLSSRTHSCMEQTRK